MIKLYVNTIIEDLYNATIGVETRPERVRKNIMTVMNIDETGMNLLYSTIPMMPGEGFFWVINFRQFVVRIQLNKDSKKSGIIFYDFKNNLDSALDCFRENRDNGWDAFSKEVIMKEFQEIESNYDSLEFAELTTELL